MNDDNFYYNVGKQALWMFIFLFGGQICVFFAISQGWREESVSIESLEQKADLLAKDLALLQKIQISLNQCNFNHQEYINKKLACLQANHKEYHKNVIEILILFQKIAKKGFEKINEKHDG